MSRTGEQTEEAVEGQLIRGPLDLSTVLRPEQFLLAIRQEYARVAQVDLDAVELKFMVQTSYDASFLAEDNSPVISIGEDGQVKHRGYVLEGLLLEGADWSVEKGTLNESWLMQSAKVPDNVSDRLAYGRLIQHGVFPMPPILVKPLTQEVVGASMLASIGPLAPYMCPVFKSSTRREFVTRIPLRSAEEISNPSHWALRNIALVLCEPTSSLS